VREEHLKNVISIFSCAIDQNISLVNQQSLGYVLFPALLEP